MALDRYPLVAHGGVCGREETGNPRARRSGADLGVGRPVACLFSGWGRPGASSRRDVSPETAGVNFYPPAPAPATPCHLRCWAVAQPGGLKRKGGGVTRAGADACGWGGPIDPESSPVDPAAAPCGLRHIGGGRLGPRPSGGLSCRLNAYFIRGNFPEIVRVVRDFLYEIVRGRRD